MSTVVVDVRRRAPTWDDDVPIFERDALAWEAVSVPTVRGPVAARFHVPEGSDAAVVMVGGVGGGFDTPARDLYPRLAEDLAAAGIGAVRVRFRDPRSLDDATHDLVAASEVARERGTRRLALVGHSFGGAVVIRAAVDAPEVVTLVTLSTQSYGADRASELQRPVLLVHGDADPILPWRASVQVARAIGDDAEIRILEGSGHDLLEHRDEVRTLVGEWLIAHLEGTRP